jgi:AhpD family alkylhydroperoxidase
MMTESPFVSHTAETAPEGSRPIVQGSLKKFGFLPAPVSKMAESPELLGMFMNGIGTFDKTTLAPMEREVMVLTFATYVECHYCVAMHSTMLAAQNAPEELVTDLREKKPLSDPRLEAMRQFTLAVIDTHGQVARNDMDSFFAAGYTQRNALEVVMGIGVYTMSTYANRMTEAKLDPPFQKYRWEGPAQ